MGSVVCGLWPSVDFSRLVHATRPFGPIRLPCFACFPMFIVRSVFLVNSSAMLVQSSPIQSNPIDPSIHLRLCVCTRLVSNCLLGLSAGSIDCCSSSSRIPNIPVLTTHINLAARSTTRNRPSGCCYSLILISLHQFFFSGLRVQCYGHLRSTCIATIARKHKQHTGRMWSSHLKFEHSQQGQENNDFSSSFGSSHQMPQPQSQNQGMPTTPRHHQHRRGQSLSAITAPRTPNNHALRPPVYLQSPLGANPAGLMGVGDVFNPPSGSFDNDVGTYTSGPIVAQAPR